MRDRAPAIFGSWMDTRRVVPPMKIQRLVRESLTRSQLPQLLDADIIVTGELDEHPATPTVWLVIDVSTTVECERRGAGVGTCEFAPSCRPERHSRRHRRPARGPGAEESGSGTGRPHS
jgi:hypothetical protein